MKRIFFRHAKFRPIALPILLLSFLFLFIFQPADSSASVDKQSTLKDSPVFAEFELWTQEYLSGRFSDDFVQKGREIAARRKAFFRELMRSEPENAIRLAVKETARARLPFSVSQYLEQSINFKGDFLIRTEDVIDPQSGEFTDARTVREVVFDAVKYTAFVYGRKSSMTTKYNIPLNGVRLDDLIAVNENSVLEIEPGEYATRNIDAARIGADGAAAQIGGEIVYFSNRKEFENRVSGINAWEEKIAPHTEMNLSPWTEGAKTVLFIRVDFAERPGEPTDPQGAPLTETRAQGVIDNSVNPFYVSNSYGKTSITTVVTPVVRMPQPQSFYTGANSDLIFTHAREAARASGFDTTNYNLDIIAFGFNNIFGYGGFARIGDKGVVLNGSFDFKTIAHELGHCYGLLHANLWRTTDGTVIGSGANIEYGDAFDVMGGGASSITHFNASYKRSLDWLTEANVQTVTRGGVYRVYAFDSINAPNGIHALKIRKDGAKNYWLEFRQLFTSTPSLINGALVRWDYGVPQVDNRRQTQVLDMTPATQTLADATLLVGQTFTDSNAGLTITVLGKGNTTPESLDVKVDFNFSQIRGADFDFDGDNRSDIGVFRPGQGVWYINKSTGGDWIINWGLSTDKIVPAKFNFDRTTDLAVYRNGIWYVYDAFGGSGLIVNFGTATDIPMPADYDGDGAAEMAVYRPSNGTWHMWNWIFSRYTSVQFGIAEDVPVPRDYDGDGKTDVAVWRPSTGVWYILRSSDGGYTIQAFGLAEDKPVPADFDGDGSADIAVYRPSEGNWYVSTNNGAAYSVFRFGLAEDVPAPADYDGDGRADYAVFRPSNGVWYLQRSALGFAAQNYGLSEDKPVAAAYVR